MAAQRSAAWESPPDADHLLLAVPLAPQQPYDLAAAQVRMEVHHEMHLQCGLSSAHLLSYMSFVTIPGALSTMKN